MTSKKCLVLSDQLSKGQTCVDYNDLKQRKEPNLTSERLGIENYCNFCLKNDIIDCQNSWQSIFCHRQALICFGLLYRLDLKELFLHVCSHLKRDNTGETVTDF